MVAGRTVPFGTDLRFVADDHDGFDLFVEICEDYWAPTPPSSIGALAGALILAPPRAGPWTMALGSAVVIWIGFVLPALLVSALSRGLSFGAGLADCAQWLAAMVVEAAVLHVVGLTKPPE